MREILFRAKNSGVWVYGYYYYSNKTHFIISPREGWGDSNYRALTYVVDPDTVGQYTGLKDKNGKEIFEGDILSFLSKSRPVKVVWISGEGKFLSVGNGIGNIYDNPELMEAKDVSAPIYDTDDDDDYYDRWEEQRELGYDCYFDDNGNPAN